MGRIKVQAAQTAPSFEVLPKGRYDFICDAVEEKQGKNYPQLVFSLRVIDGPYADKKVMHFQTLAPPSDDKAGSGDFVKEMLDAFGVEYEAIDTDVISKRDGKPEQELDFDSDDFIGKTASANARIEEYNGRDNNRLNQFAPIDANTAGATQAAPASRATTQATRGAAAPTTRAQQPAANRGATQPAAGAAARRSRV